MRAETTIRTAYVVACVTLLCGALGFRGAVRGLNAFLHKLPAPLREPLSTLPTTLGKWRAVTKDEPLSSEVLEALGTNTYMSRMYAIDGNPDKGALHLHVAFYTGLIDSVPHIPERCFTAGGLIQKSTPERVDLALDRDRWKLDGGPVNAASGERYPSVVVVDPVTLREQEVLMPVGESKLTLIEFQKSDDPEMRILGGYLFIANGRMTPSALAVRDLAFSMSEKYAYFCKVQFTGQYRGNAAAIDKYKAEVADLLGELLPHLMRRLPHWPEYEAKSGAPSAKPT